MFAWSGLLASFEGPGPTNFVSRFSIKTESNEPVTVCSYVDLSLLCRFNHDRHLTLKNCSIPPSRRALRGASPSQVDQHDMFLCHAMLVAS